MPEIEKFVHEPVTPSVEILEGISTTGELAATIMVSANNLSAGLLDTNKAQMVKSARELMTLMTAALLQAGINPVLAKKENDGTAKTT